VSSSTRAISGPLNGDGVSTALVLLVITLLSGCAVRRPPPVPQLPVDADVSNLAARDHVVDSLQTPAITEYSGPEGHFKAREQLTVRRPADLRVEASSPLGIAMVVTADSHQIAVFNPSDNTLMRGAANAATLARFTQIPIEPRQAVRLLLGLAPDDSILARPPSAVRSEETMKVLDYISPGQPSYELGFSGGHLALVRQAQPGGQVVYEVHYGDYRDIGAIEFPCVIDAHFFTRATSIKFRYQDPAIDRNFPDSVFVLSPGPGTRLINLSAAFRPPAPDIKG
jgi:Domain of unknown function (DUF4292)